jgi:hypothetical protein
MIDLFGERVDRREEENCRKKGKGFDHGRPGGRDGQKRGDQDGQDDNPGRDDQEPARGPRP